MRVQPRTNLVLAPAPLVEVNGAGVVALVHGGRAPSEVRASIDEFTQAALADTANHVEFHVEHTIEDGMYMRKLFIPKGTMIVGKIHLKACINIVAKGDITVLTEFGVRRATAGFTGVSRPGLQKVGLAHEDTVFINVFRTDLTDITAIEMEIAATEREPIELEELTCL